MNYPEIRIKDGWLLREAVSKPLHELRAKDGDMLADVDDMERIINAYNKAWQPYEERILTSMCELLNLNFRHTIIDVYIAPWFGAISDPMVIGTKYSPERFVTVLAHELCHRLLSDNVQTSYNTPWLTEWKQLFGDEHTFNCLVHIPVHAMLESIFADDLNEPLYVKIDREKCRKYKDYNDAWKYVDEIGYVQIIDQLKNSYSNLYKQYKNS